MSLFHLHDFCTLTNYCKRCGQLKSHTVQLGMLCLDLETRNVAAISHLRCEKVVFERFKKSMTAPKKEVQDDSPCA